MIHLKIKTKASKHYFTARIFDTKKDMYSYYLKYAQCREEDKNSDNDHFGFNGFKKDCNFSAIVLPYEKVKFKDGKEVRSNDIGEVLFYRGKLGSGIIAHEMLHCAMWHDRLIAGNKEATYGAQIGDDEERMGHVLYDFVRSFVNQCFKKGIFQ